MVLTETENAFKLSRNLLLASGLWPMENKTPKYKLKSAISWVTILGLCLTIWMEFFNDLHDLVKLSGIFYVLISFLNAIVKQIAFTFNYKAFQETLIHLKNPVFTSHPEDLDYYMIDTVKFSTKLTKTYLYSIACAIALLGIFPIIDKKPLPFPFPYDVAAWNHVGLDTICISLIDIAAAQLDILAEKIVRIEAASKFYKDHKTRDEAVLIQLKHCVEHHLAIIKLIENTEKIFSVAILSQYLTSSLVLCDIIFTFIWLPLSFQFIMLVDYLICVLIQLFFYCWCGNKVLTKSLQVGYACYTFNWYDYGSPVRKYIFIMMERSKRPSCITALKFTVLSIESLTNIFQRAYSMLTILLNMYRKMSTDN